MISLISFFGGIIIACGFLLCPIPPTSLVFFFGGITITCGFLVCPIPLTFHAYSLVTSAFYFFALFPLPLLSLSSGSLLVRVIYVPYSPSYPCLFLRGSTSACGFLFCLDPPTYLSCLFLRGDLLVLVVSISPTSLSFSLSFALRVRKKAIVSSAKGLCYHCYQCERPLLPVRGGPCL